jgi:hypothetical protein
MGEENKEVTVPATDTKPAEGAKPEPKVLVGFTIGLRDDGNLLWKLDGESPNIATLVGLCKIAEQKIDSMTDATLQGNFKSIEMAFTTISGQIRQLHAALVPAPAIGEQPKTEQK